MYSKGYVLIGLDMQKLSKEVIGHDLQRLGEVLQRLDEQSYGMELSGEDMQRQAENREIQHSKGET